MGRERFAKVVEEVLDSLPEEFRARIENVADLVEDLPPNLRSARSGRRRLLLGLFHGVPTTKRSFFVAFASCCLKSRSEFGERQAPKLSRSDVISAHHKTTHPELNEPLRCQCP